MDIGNDIDIAYYNGTGAEVVEKGFLCYLNQVVYGLSIPLTFFQKGVMNALKSCPGQLNGNVIEMMRVCEALNQKWRDGGIVRQFVADDVLKYYKFKYVKDRKSGYLFSDSARPKFFDFEFFGRPWCDHLVMVREPNPKAVADTSIFFNIVCREGNELNKVLGELGTSSSLVRRPRVKITVPPSEQTTPVQIPPVGTEGVDADLSVAWKSAVEVLKLAAADRDELVQQHDAEKAALREQFEKEKVLEREKFEKEKALQKDQFEKEVAAAKKEVEDEAKKVVDTVVASQNKLIQAFYFWGLGREDVDLALAGKYSEIIFPGDDASPVADQSLTPPVANDKTEEEVVRLRGKVIDMEKALNRARDFINRTQEGQRAMRIIFFNIKEEDRKIQAQLKIDLRQACDELERCKDHNACLEREKVECNKLLHSLEKRVTLLEMRLLNAQKRLQVSQSRLKKKITPKRGKHAINMDHE
ncbi:hypothetical protein GIB67_012752, partial [Kingdonia uniflora]